MSDVDRVAAEVERAAGKGLRAAAIFLTARIREVLSVPAPRVRVLGKRGRVAGVLYYRATTPATPNAPPRKLSGKLRQSIAYEMAPDGLSARIGSGLPYAARLEFGGHPFLRPTIEKYADDLARIIGLT